MIQFLLSVRKQFEYYKLLGEQTIERLTIEQLNWQFNNESNSVAMIVKHLHGNMISRWTDFLTTDGEKEWRNRDSEFNNDDMTIDELLKLWQSGWQCLFEALLSITDDDLVKVIYIRNQGHTLIEAINRQLAHYPYHVGQIVFIGKMLLDNQWTSLSIPRGNSSAFNRERFEHPKSIHHFTAEYFPNKSS